MDGVLRRASDLDEIQVDAYLNDVARRSPMPLMRLRVASINQDDERSPAGSVFESGSQRMAPVDALPNFLSLPPCCRPRHQAGAAPAPEPVQLPLPPDAMGLTWVKRRDKPAPGRRLSRQTVATAPDFSACLHGTPGSCTRTVSSRQVDAGLAGPAQAPLSGAQEFRICAERQQDIEPSRWRPCQGWKTRKRQDETMQ